MRSCQIQGNFEETAQVIAVLVGRQLELRNVGRILGTEGGGGGGVVGNRELWGVFGNRGLGECLGQGQGEYFGTGVLGECLGTGG